MTKCATGQMAKCIPWHGLNRVKRESAQVIHVMRVDLTLCVTQVHYRAVPGLSFEMCQSGSLTPEVKAEFVAAIRWLDDVKHVHAITGDCALLPHACSRPIWSC